MSMAVKAASRAAMVVHAAFAQRTDHRMAFTHIDERFKQMTTKPFDPDYMKALFEHGQRVGKEGSAFRENPFDVPPLQTAGRR
jgi:hypothetical protein